MLRPASFCKAMVAEDVDDGFAIRNDVTLEVPLLAQLVLQQELVHTCWLPIDAVVGAHHRTSSSSVTVAETQEGTCLTDRANLDVVLVARWLGPTVYGEVF